jgi:cytochrome c556
MTRAIRRQASTRTVFAASLLMLLPLASVATADEAKIKYRQSVMQAVGGHTSALAAIVKGEVPFSEEARPHALALDALAQGAGKIFTPESAKGETEALPAIWEKPDAFRKVLADFQAATAALAKAAEGGDLKAIGAALGPVGQACKACHDDFRSKVQRIHKH